VTQDLTAEQYITQLPTGPDTLTVAAMYERSSPDELFAYWTTPALLSQWWPEQAHTDPRTGRSYDFVWPKMGWHLRGEYTAVEPSRRLVFTWRWDHEPDTPTRTVEVLFDPVGDLGTQITVTHGTYAEADFEERDGHLEGWTYFLTRLRDALAQE
jgi:uncharacterized protein YndB with AHSA1/START domain